jgi:hypothetical protein
MEDIEKSKSMDLKNPLDCKSLNIYDLENIQGT